MFIESIELLNYRNYEQLHMEQISYMEIMPRERQIFWKQFMCAVQQNPIRAVRIRTLFGSGKRSLILK